MGRNNYQNGESCQVVLQASQGRTVQVQFTRMNTEATYDAVRLYDGASISSRLLGTFSGATVQGIILLWVVSYFSGVVQSPMTAFIILIEMTGALAFTLPLGVASILAYEASRRVCPVSLYEALAENFLKSGVKAET